MLHVQNYLRSGKTLEDLKTEFSIKSRVNEQLGVVNLNYDQILSDANNDIVRECRSLILHLDTWDVASMAFRRFFNLGEARPGMDFDWDNFDVFEKLDGSLISVFHLPKHGWIMSTRSVPGADTPFDDSGETFASLVHRTLADMGTSWDAVTSYFSTDCTYILELTAPENQIVVQHKDRKLSLLGIRHLPTLREMRIEDWLLNNPGFPLPLAPKHKGFDPRVDRDVIEGRNPLEFEGFVLVDKDFNRIKVKSSAYCLMSSRKDSLAKSNAARIELILSERDDDVMPMLPKFVQDKMTDLKARIVALANRIDADYLTVKDIEVQKDFAMAVLPMDKIGGCSNAMFAIRKGSVPDGISFLRQAQPKSILQMIRVKDEEAEGVPEC
jgi:hypothetical protein